MRHDASVGAVKKCERFSDEDKLRLLKDLTQRVYLQTESWCGRLGMDLAYLCHAILNDEQVYLAANSELYLLLKEWDPEDNFLFWRYIKIGA